MLARLGYGIGTKTVCRGRHADRGSSSPAGMVREGHDSTVRPKLQTYEFDNGRLYLDQWAADGKPAWGRIGQGRLRALAVFSCFAVPFGFIFVDFGDEEHVFSPVRRTLLNWWRTYTTLDVLDVAKACSVGPPILDHVEPVERPSADAPKEPERKFKQPGGLI